MRNFNKVGRIVDETIVDNGITVRLTKVWPWKRRELSEGMKYLVTAFDDKGFEFYNNCHPHRVLYSYVVMKYREYKSPRTFIQHGITAHAFSLEACLAEYVKSIGLPVGNYLVMIPSSRPVREEFWKSKGIELASDYRADCYAADIQEFGGDLANLVSEIRKEFSGRYFKATVTSTFVTIEELE